MNLRRLVHPGFLIALLFVGQFLFWYLFMPEVPTLQGAAPRYVSPSALLRWALLFFLLESGVYLGALVPLSSGAHRVPVAAKQRVRLWWSWGLGVLAIAFLGEIVYVRVLIQNIDFLGVAIAKGNLAMLGERVRAARIVGVSSLNNLFLLATAIFAALSFHPFLPVKTAVRARRWLLGLGVAVLLHSLFLAARMFFVYYSLVVLAAYMVYGSLLKKRRISLRSIFLIVLVLLMVVWLGELLRGGLAFAKLNSLPLLSAKVQTYIWDRLVQGYLAADFNNALIVLDCEPSMKLWSTTMFSGPLGIQATYKQCPYWESAYGTVNVLALWWYDWGWAALFIAFVKGFAIGFFYRLRTRLLELRPEGLYYLIVFPGIFAITRINYFFLTIFVIPFAFGSLITLLWQASLLSKGAR